MMLIYWSFFATDVNSAVHVWLPVLDGKHLPSQSANTLLSCFPTTVDDIGSNDRPWDWEISEHTKFYQLWLVTAEKSGFTV